MRFEGKGAKTRTETIPCGFGEGFKKPYQLLRNICRQEASTHTQVTERQAPQGVSKTGFDHLLSGQYYQGNLNLTRIL